MAGLAEALLGATKGYATSAQETGRERARLAAQRAFRDEGWARDDAVRAEERGYQERKTEEQRKFASEEAEKERKFKAEEKAKDRAAQRRTKGATSKMEIKQLEDGSVIATKGGDAFRLSEQGSWIPIEYGTVQDFVTDTVDVEDKDAEKGFFDTAKDWVSGLFSSEEEPQASPMSQAAAGQTAKPVANYDQVKAQVKAAYDEGGFGAADRAIRDNNLSQLQQVALLFDLGISSIPERDNIGTADTTRAGQSPQAIQGMLQGTGVGLSEFQKVKNAYPNRSDEDIIKAIQNYNSERSRSLPQ